MNKNKNRLPFSNLNKPNRDSNPAIGYDTLYGSNGSPGVLEAMSETHMRIATRVANVRDRIAAKEWRVEPPKNATAEEMSFSIFCDTLLSDMRMDVQNDVGNLGFFLASAFESIWFGHWVGEMSLYPDDTSTLGVRFEVFEVSNSTISSWEWDRDELTGIRQQTSRGSAFIPRKDLLIAHYGGNFPVGKGRLRSALFWFESVKALAISFSEQAASAKGKLVTVLEGATSQQQLDEAADFLVDVETPGGVSGVIIGGPTGVADIRYDFPSSVLDPTNAYNYFDGQIDQLFDSSLQSLGLTSGYGSRALGDILAAIDDEKGRATLDAIGYLVGKQVFRWISKQFSKKYSGRLPLLQTKRVKSPVTVEELIGNISAAASAGLLDVTDNIKAQVKDAVIDTPISE